MTVNLTTRVDMDLEPKYGSVDERSRYLGAGIKVDDE